MIDLAKPMSGLAGPAAGLEAGVGKFFAEAIFQRNAHAAARWRTARHKCPINPADLDPSFAMVMEQFRRARHWDKDDGDVAFRGLDVELVVNRRPLFLFSCVGARTRRRIHILRLIGLRGARAAGIFYWIRSLSPSSRQGLRLLQPSHKPRQPKPSFRAWR